MKSIRDIANKLSNKVIRQFTIFIGLLSITVICLALYLDTVQKLDSTISAIHSPIVYAVEIGDVFRIRSDFLSLVENESINHFMLKLDSGEVIEDTPKARKVYDSISIATNTVGIITSLGEPSIYKVYKTKLQSGRVLTTIISRAINFQMIFSVFIITLLSAFAIRRIFSPLVSNLSNELSNPLHKISQIIDQQGSTGTIDKLNIATQPFLDVKEINTIYYSFVDLFRRYQIAEKNAIYAKLAREVAHDIRSPLSAFQVAVSSIDQTPQASKALLRKTAKRINEIAENLLLKSRTNPSYDMLLTVCEDIIDEKKTIYSDDNIQLNLVIKQNSLAAKSNVPLEFKRVLSNIVDNAIEACEGKSGKVKIELQSTTKENHISVTDDGKGIDSKFIENMNIKGIPSNKKNGNGLGLSHAANSIKAWGGQLEISSKLGVGTIVTIKFPHFRTSM